MPALLSHTHWQATQANAKNQSLSKRVWLSNRTDGRINKEGATHGIVHEGFSGLRAFVARKKKSVLTERQSLRNPALHHAIKRNDGRMHLWKSDYVSIEMVKIIKSLFDYEMNCQ